MKIDLGVGGEGGGGQGQGVTESQDHILVTVTPTVSEGTRGSSRLTLCRLSSTPGCMGIPWGPQAGPALLGGVLGLPFASLGLRKGSRA